jgi:hypothetical protein
VLASVILALTPVYIYRIGHSATGNEQLLFESIFFWYLGAILLVAPRYSKKLYLLELIDKVFTKTSVIGGKYRSKIYGGLACIAAAVTLFRWIIHD